jgi:hypothetical protein
MKRPHFFFLLGVGLLSVGALSAHSHHHVSVEINTGPQLVVAERPRMLVVEAEPPLLMQEEISGCPGPDYVWIQGNWVWDGRWVWSSGRWALRPHPEAVWVPGLWSRGEGNWVWVEGRWR